MFRKYVALYFLALSLGSQFTLASVYPNEQIALEDLYNSTNGDNWTVKWDLTTDPCDGITSWYGLTCRRLAGDVHFHVFNVELPNNNLDGAIPAGLVNLPALRKLDLSQNKLQGTIPQEPNNLQYLSYLDLSGNQLSGDVPTSGNLIALLYLNLSDNLLTGPIPLRSDFAELKELHLGNNALTGGLPPEIVQLTELTNLNLNDNHLSGEMPEILGLAKLKELKVNGNKLKNLIPDLPDSLETADFSYNAFASATNDAHVLQPDWYFTQTVPPNGLTATPISITELQIKWDSIAYQEDPGNFEVKYGTVSGNLFQSAGYTPDKKTSTLTASSLTPGEHYYFSVTTTTDPHAHNKNRIISEPSPEISPPMAHLQVSVVPLGFVSIGSITGFVCTPTGGVCEFDFAKGTDISLFARVYDIDATRFDYWIGNACASQDASCNFTLEQDESVTAVFQCIYRFIPEHVQPPVTTIETFSCDELISIDGFVIDEGGDVTFMAKNLITLGSGFVVKEKGIFRAQITAP